jgi:hypothetical protein
VIEVNFGFQIESIAGVAVDQVKIGPTGLTQDNDPKEELKNEGKGDSKGDLKGS